MQQTEQISNALTSTCFDLDSYEQFSHGEDIAPTLVVSPPPFLRKQIPLSPLPVLPTVCLSLQPAQKRLDNWRLVLVRGVADSITPNHIIGAAVQIAKGRTSPIASFDPFTRRVRTHSGSIYELGTPEMAFERAAPEVMRSLGF